MSGAADGIAREGRTDYFAQTDPMKEKSVHLAAAVLVLLAILLSVRFCADRKNEDFPDGLSLVCQNCHYAFMLSHKKFIKLYSEQQDASAFPCPNCRQRTAVRSIPCDECGKPFPASPFIDQESTCPACQNKDATP
jgi:predicted RNA-binding Zn-ribbon protein involved in translation (DUF1610 family)